jgi:hypothetical protein
MIPQRHLLLLVLALVSSTSGAQTIRISCPHLDDKSQRIACLEALFSQDNYHFTMASLPPSNGFGPGLVLEYRRHLVSTAPPGGEAKKSLIDLTATLAGTTNSSWLAGGDFRWVLPRGYDAAKGSGENAYLWLENHQEAETLHASFAHRTVRTLYYFGEGSGSRNQQFVFAEDDNYGFLRFRYPVNDSLAFTFEGGADQTTLPAISDASAVAKHFPSTLPGLATQPTYAKFSIGASTSNRAEIGGVFSGLPKQDDPHFQKELPFIAANQASFTWNEAVDGSPYTFEQFTFASDEQLGLKFRSRNFFSADKHPFVTKYVCENNKQRQLCSFGEIDVHALLTLSHSSGGDQLPFYLEPTLGGTDIDSRVTLRGWDNYRFRGRDRALLQFEYGLTVWDPFGAFVFYDAGKVGASPSDLSPLDYRQDAGLGLSVRLRGNVIAQTYIAWGAGSTRWNYNFSKSF